MGVIGLCEGDRRRRYGAAFRRGAVELIAAGYGQHRLARELGMPCQTAEEWIMLYRCGGVAAVVGVDGRRTYPYETKLMVVRDVVDHGMSIARAMAGYGIVSRSPAARWGNDYRAGGPERLRPKPQGRPKGSGSRPHPQFADGRALRDEVGYLQAKVAYLEQLHALRAEGTPRAGGRAG